MHLRSRFRRYLPSQYVSEVYHASGDVPEVRAVLFEGSAEGGGPSVFAVVGRDGLVGMVSY